MNVQTVFSNLNGRAKISSIFCGVYAGIMWMIAAFCALVFGLAGVVGGSLFGRLGNIDRNSVVAGYEVMGNLFLSALMGAALLVVVAGIFMSAVPAVLFTVGCVNGLSKAKKERTAVQTPGAMIDFRLFRADAIYKLTVSGVVLALTVWVQMESFFNNIKNMLGSRTLDLDRIKSGGGAGGLGASLLIISPAVVIFVLSWMNLAEIGRWRKWLEAVRAQNGSSM